MLLTIYLIYFIEFRNNYSLYILTIAEFRGLNLWMSEIEKKGKVKLEVQAKVMHYAMTLGREMGRTVT